MARTVGDELVILDPSSGKYFGLNDVGALIWEQLADECTRDELVILDPSSGKYFGLNDVGALIWEQLADECTRAELIAAVVADYDVDADEASKDVDDLIDQFRAAELIAP